MHLRQGPAVLAKVDSDLKKIYRWKGWNTPKSGTVYKLEANNFS